jgi:chromosome segregation ATPase
MALNWLRRLKQKESKPKPLQKNEGLNERVDALTMELDTLNHKVADLVSKEEEYERVILELREESFELRTQNESLATEKEVLKKAVKALEQQLRKLKKKRKSVQ